MLIERDVPLADGRNLHVYDTGPLGPDEIVLVWHHGTPNVGPPPQPLLPASAELGIRWLSYDRPAYGGSTPHPGRSIASAAADVAALADAHGVDRFAVMGHSGGGPHALACAALLPTRVFAAVSGAGLAPFDASDLDWFAGMAPAGAGELAAAVTGRTALEDLLNSSDFDPTIFTPADHRILGGPWSWLGEVAQIAGQAGITGMVDDDLAYVAPWGFEPSDIEVPVLLLHGAQDRVVPVTHGKWLVDRLPSAELRVGEDDGHISILHRADDALTWVKMQAAA